MGRLRVSIVDAANPLVFCRFADLGLTGQERPGGIDADTSLRDHMEAVRAEAAVAAGIVSTAAEATRDVSSVPKLAMVAEPLEYVQVDGGRSGPERAWTSSQR